MEAREPVGRVLRQRADQGRALQGRPGGGVRRRLVRLPLSGSGGDGPGEPAAGAARPQAGAEAARARALPARQQAVRRDVRPHASAGARRGEVPDRPGGGAGRGGGRQARQADRALRRDGGKHARRAEHRRPQPRVRRRGEHGPAGQRRHRYRRCAGGALPAEDHARRDQPRRLRHPFRALREVLPHPLPARRHPVRGRAAADGDQGQGGLAHQGAVEARHFGEARAAGRPHEAGAVEEPRHRLPGQHPADPVRREDRHAYSRPHQRAARDRGAGLRAVAEGGAAQRRAAALRHGAGDRPDRLGQDGVALYLPQHPQQAGRQHLDRGRPGGNPAARHQPGQRQRQGRTDLLGGAEILPAPGSRRHHGRRDPRPGNRRHRHQGRADRPHGDVHAAHQRRPRHPDPSAQHGGRAVQRRLVGDPDHRPAPGAAPLLVQEAGRHSFRSAAGGGVHGRPARRHVAALRASRLRDLRRHRLQGAGRHLSGDADHRRDDPHHSQGRQRIRHC